MDGRPLQRSADPVCLQMVQIKLTLGSLYRHALLIDRHCSDGADAWCKWTLMQGLFVLYAHVGSGDPVRVLPIFCNEYSGYVVAFIYCVRLCTTCHYLGYVLTTTGCLCLYNSGLLTRDDVHCSASHGQLLQVLYCTCSERYILGPFTYRTHQNQTRKCDKVEG